MPINVFKSAKIQIFADTFKNVWSLSQLQATITFICFYSLGSLEKRKDQKQSMTIPLFIHYLTAN